MNPLMRKSEYDYSQGSNTNASATASEVEGEDEPSSDDNAEDHSEGEIDSENEVEINTARGKSITPDRGHNAVSQALHQVQNLVNKRGYIDAKELERLTGGLELNTGRKDKAQYLGTRLESKAKRRTGGGDREFQQPKSKARTGRNRVQFLKDPDSQHHDSDSEMTIYQSAVRNKIDQYRSSSSSDELNLHDLSLTRDNRNNDDHNDRLSHEFISEIRKHYEDQKRRSDGRGTPGDASYEPWS